MFVELLGVQGCDGTAFWVFFLSPQSYVEQNRRGEKDPDLFPMSSCFNFNLTLENCQSMFLQRPRSKQAFSIVTGHSKKRHL